MMIGDWRIEGQDYMGHVDCTCTNSNWNGGEIHENDREVIYSHHDWNVCIIEKKKCLKTSDTFFSYCYG